MKIKTSELTGLALNFAVAKCERGLCPRISDGLVLSDTVGYGLYFSSDWSQGGPIIEREGITTTHIGSDWEDAWKARTGDGHWQGRDVHGPTPLIAAMRCYVASKLGDEVEVPDELA